MPPHPVTTCSGWPARESVLRARQNFKKEDVYPCIPLVYASHPMRVSQVFLLAIATASAVFAQDLKPVAERLAAQNDLFDEQYEADLRNFPERATAFGDYRYNDRLAEYTLDAIQRRHEADQAFLSRLEAIPTTGFSDQDQLSHDLLVRVLTQRITDYSLKEYEMPINQQSGVPVSYTHLTLPTILRV